MATAGSFGNYYLLEAPADLIDNFIKTQSNPYAFDFYVFWVRLNQRSTAVRH